MTPVDLYCLTASLLRDQIAGEPAACVKAAKLLNSYGIVAAASHNIVIPVVADSGETLAAIPALMSGGSYHRERSRLLTMYLGAIEEDVNRRLRCRVEELVLGGAWWSFAATRLFIWRAAGHFLALRICGWLFRWHIPVRFAWLAESTERLMCAGSQHCNCDIPEGCEILGR